MEEVEKRRLRSLEVNDDLKATSTMTWLIVK